MPAIADHLLRYAVAEARRTSEPDLESR